MSDVLMRKNVHTQIFGVLNYSIWNIKMLNWDNQFQFQCCYIHFRLFYMEARFRQWKKNYCDFLSHNSELRVIKSELRVIKSELRVIKSELRVIKSELRVIKSELRVIKSELRVIKSELRDIKSELRYKLRFFLWIVSLYLRIMTYDLNLQLQVYISQLREKRHNFERKSRNNLFYFVAETGFHSFRD